MTAGLPKLSNNIRGVAKNLLIGLLVTAFALSVSMTSAYAPSGAALSLSFDSSQAKNDLLTLTNEARSRYGLASLILDPRLAEIAQWRSEDMVERGYFSHFIPPGNNILADVLSDKGVEYISAGENLAEFSFTPDLVSKIQDGFMASSEHRKNILNPNYNAIGIGAAQTSDGQEIFTVIFMWK